MDNTLRWTLFGVLVGVNLVCNVLFHGWLQITIGAVVGAVLIALLVDYFARGRGRG